MKKRLIMIFVIIVIPAAIFYVKSYCFQGDIIQVNDVTQKQILTLLEKDRPQSVYGINILITGYIDGIAIIQRACENQKMHESYTISGKINLRIGGDWYRDKCLIIYQPSNVKSGKLQIKYGFRTL